MASCKSCLHVETCEIAKMTYGHYADDDDCNLFEDRAERLEAEQALKENDNG